MEVPVLLHQVDDNINPLAGRAGTFCNQTTNTVTDTAVVEFLIFFNSDVTVVRDNYNTFFIYKSIRETRPFGG